MLPRFSSAVAPLMLAILALAAMPGATACVDNPECITKHGEGWTCDHGVGCVAPASNTVECVTFETSGDCIYHGCMWNENDIDGMQWCSAVNADDNMDDGDMDDGMDDGMENMCPYTNSLWGGSILAITTQGQVTSCDQIIDSSIPAGTTSTPANVQLYCQDADGAPAGIFTDTAGFMPYAHICPETCTRVPACATAVDNNAFMDQAFGNSCAPYANAGYCLKNCIWTDGVEYCNTNGIEVIVQAACPASCAAATPPANAALFGTGVGGGDGGGDLDGDMDDSMDHADLSVEATLQLLAERATELAASLIQVQDNFYASVAPLETRLAALEEVGPAAAFF